MADDYMMRRMDRAIDLAWGRAQETTRDVPVGAGLAPYFLAIFRRLAKQMPRGGTCTCDECLDAQVCTFISELLYEIKIHG